MQTAHQHSLAFASRFEGGVLTLLDVFRPWELDAFGSMQHSALSGLARAEAMATDMRFGSVDLPRSAGRAFAVLLAAFGAASHRKAMQNNHK